MYKRGQFYIVMAFILIIILIGFFSLRTNFQSQKIRVYDLKEELDIESGSVIDFRIFNPTQNPIEEFIELYSTYSKDSNAELYFIYGNENEISSYTYDRNTLGAITAGKSGLTINPSKLEQVKKPIEKKDKIEIVLGNQRFEFDLKPGENFYYVIQAEKNGEIYSLTN